jgi:ParB family chromosome partitioning protein
MARTSRKPTPRREGPPSGRQGRGTNEGRASALGPVVEIALREIDGLDPCNARRVEPAAAEIAELADDIAARGLLNPIILRGAPDGYRVLAGGRRWCALKASLPDTTPVRARIFAGPDEDATALSLAENIARQDLHPLDEADRVAERAQTARPEAVARALSKTPRWVRERIALSALPEVARLNWLSGAIGLAQARALTVGDADAIEALFARPDARAILSDARTIRAALLPKSISARAPSAVFVGLDDYVFAGGAVHEDLFERESWLLDADLLRKLERRKLSAIADRLCEAEGWGTVLFDVGDATRAVAPDFTPAELDEIERLEASPDAADHARLAELQRLGALRAVAEADRARYGLYVGLDSEGRPDIQRGVVLAPNSVSHAEARAVSSPDPRAEAGASAASLSEAPVFSRVRAGAHASRPEPVEGRSLKAHAALAAPPATLVLHAGARRLAETAASRAVAAAIQRSLPGVVMRIALAAWLSSGDNPLGLPHVTGPGAAPGALARRVAKLRFADALQALGAQADDDADQGFVDAVAASVDFRSNYDEAAALGLLDFLDDLEPAPCLRPAIARLLDYGQFFALAGRAVALEAIRECAGAAAASERAWMKDEALANEAALLARAREWLPEFLRAET